MSSRAPFSLSSWKICKCIMCRYQQKHSYIFNIFKRAIICLDDDKISWLFGYVIVNDFLLIFHPGFYLGHKAVSRDRIWMGLKRWETCKRDVLSTDSTQLLRVSVGKKKRLSKKTTFGLWKNVSYLMCLFALILHFLLNFFVKIILLLLFSFD